MKADMSSAEEQNKQQTGPSNVSLLYRPFRTLGLVCGSVALQWQRRGTETFLTVPIGPAFQIYDASRLHLKFASVPLDEDIVAMQCIGDETLVAHGCQVSRYRRAQRVGVVHRFRAPVRQLHLFGQQHCLVCTEDQMVSVVRRDGGRAEDGVYAEIPLAGDFVVSAVLHPDTYLNKMLLASLQGTLQLWNLKSGKLIYQFANRGAAILCITQSPVVDVVAMGLADGTILIHDIRRDVEVMQFRQQDPVTAISFRTDGATIMATAGSGGEVAFWDLEKLRLVHVLKNCHDGSVHSLHFLTGQPILVSASVDNSIKIWIFDEMDGAPRLLKSRSGHRSPPSRVRFHDEEGKWMLSLGRDHTLRLFSLFRDEQNVELSQGHIEKRTKQIGTMHADQLKLPNATDVDSATVRQRDWDCVLTCHQGLSVARTWSLENRRLGSHAFHSTDRSIVKCVHVSKCGNFGLLGCQSGRIDAFHMQSGIHRLSIDAHKKAVTGVALDELNRFIVSTSLDGTVKMWKFSKGSLEQILVTMDMAIDRLVMHKNELGAFVAADFGIRVFDIGTRKVVREFHGHNARITDICFSPDGRWLLSSGCDRVMRTWDLPLGSQIDQVCTDKIITSMSFSPTAEHLATTYANQNGIHLWTNKMALAHSSSIQVCRTDSGMEDDLPFDTLFPFSTEPKVDSANSEIKLATVSLEPKTKWKNLLSLDLIKKRNRPAQPKMKLAPAPFFLPSLAGSTDGRLTLSTEENQKKEVVSAVQFSKLSIDTELNRMLKKMADSAGSLTAGEIFAYARSLSPSALKFEILSLVEIGNSDPLRTWLDVLAQIMEERSNLELVQAFLSVTLQTHSVIISEDIGAFMARLQRLYDHLGQAWLEMENLLQSSLCLTDFFRNKAQ